MSKIMAVAWNEFRQFVLTRTFWVLLLLSPLIIGLFVVLTLVAESSRDLSDRRILVVDRSGALLEELIAEAEHHNELEIYKAGDSGPRVQVEARFLPMAFDGERDMTDQELLAKLSSRVRNGEAVGFLILEADVLESGGDGAIRYFSQNQTYQILPAWLERTLNRLIRNRRLEAAGLDSDRIEKLTEPRSLSRYGLAEIGDDGTIREPEREDPMVTYLLPLGAMMILFFCANMSSPIMLNSVMEEKMQKIVEVLLSSVSPLQLMTGKLIGSVWVALTLFLVYLAPAAGFLIWSGYLDDLPTALLLWFPVFLVITLLTLGSVWAGIGAVCAELKDTQNFAGMAVMLLVVPLILATVILESPHAPFAVVTSLLPACYPFLMTIRLMASPGPETWELWGGLGINLLFTLFTLWAGARIFRRGILNQGSTPSMRTVIRWLFEKET